MNTKKIFTIYLVLVLFFSIAFTNSTYSQEKIDVTKLTREQILELDYEELMMLSLEDLMKLADIAGMSTDELLQLAIVSASKKSESLFDSPLSATVLTGENIKKAGVTSIMEALRLVPGVIVREQTPGNYDIHVRGYDDLDPNGLISFTRNAITLVMINNRIVYNEFQGNTYWELLQVSVDDIDKIEVVRGPAAAMYGPNAVSGVINIITKKPNEKKGLHVSSYSQAGNYNTILGNAAVSYAMNNGFSVRVAGNYDYRKRHNIDYFILSGKKFLRNDTNKIIGTENVTFVNELTGDEINIAGGQAVDPDLNPSKATPNYKQRYPYTDLGTDRKSINTHLAFNKKDYNINLMGGYSTAMIQDAFPINNFAALSTDSMSNMFGHLWGNYKNFSFSFDHNRGDVKTLGSGSALQAEYNISNANLEYSWDVFENFNIKPGFSYRSAVFNGRILGSTQLDANYNMIERDGDQVNTLLSGYIRAEYKFNNLRLIAALRADKFQYPDKVAISPLITATYKVNKNLLTRVSYGQATRSPFMINLFTNLDMSYPIPNPAGMGIPLTYKTIYGAHYRGTEYQDKEYQLLNVQEAEIGTRYNINKWLSVDMELFWSQMKNLDVFAKVSRGVRIVPTSATTGNVYIDDTTSFVDIDIKPQQIGGTFSVFANPMKNLDIQFYITLQETEIKGYYDSTGYKSYYKGATNATIVYIGGQPAEVLDSKKDADSENTKNLTHKATPSYFGGININYRPIKKLNINVNSYFYGEQTFSIGLGNGSNAVAKVDANVIVNSTISYEFYKGMKAFINGRNLVGGNKRQFALTDKINTMILGGFNINF